MAIGKCIVRNRAIHVYDESEREICYFYDDGRLIGYTSSLIFTVKDNSGIQDSKIITVISEEGYPVKSFYITGDVIGLVNETVIYRYRNQQMTIDKNGNLIDKHYV